MVWPSHKEIWVTVAGALESGRPAPNRHCRRRASCRARSTPDFGQQCGHCILNLLWSEVLLYANHTVCGWTLRSQLPQIGLNTCFMIKVISRKRYRGCWVEHSLHSG